MGSRHVMVCLASGFIGLDDFKGLTVEYYYFTV